LKAIKIIDLVTLAESLILTCGSISGECRGVAIHIRFSELYSFK